MTGAPSDTVLDRLLLALALLLELPRCWGSAHTPTRASTRPPATSPRTPPTSLGSFAGEFAPTVLRTGA